VTAISAGNHALDKITSDTV